MAKARPAASEALSTTGRAVADVLGDLVFRLGSRLDDVARALKGSGESTNAGLTALAEAVSGGCDEVAGALREVAAALEKDADG